MVPPPEQVQAEREGVHGVQPVRSAAADRRDAARRQDVRPAERGKGNAARGRLVRARYAARECDGVVLCSE